MKTKLKKMLASSIGHENYLRLDRFVKIFRVYANRFRRPSKKLFINTEFVQRHRQLSVEGSEIFFGYYDHSPILPNHGLCLAHRVRCPAVNMFNHNAVSRQTADVGYFDLSLQKPEFVKVGETSTWCWQQGARLRWFPSGENTLIYNELNDGEYGAVVRHTNGDVVQKLSFPIYDLSADGKYALSLNFSRLHRMRPGYGYRNVPDETLPMPQPENDGVWICDLEADSKSLIFSLNELAHYAPTESMKGATHYINHLSWNPSGSYFLFFHIWARDGKRETRVFVCDSEGKNLNLLISDGASHYCWESDNSLLIVTTENNSLSYKRYNILSLEKQDLSHWLPLEDGHPSLIETGKVITDSYPDKFGMQHLMLCNEHAKDYKVIGSFFASPLAMGEARCDLHPRQVADTNKMSFDSAYSGHRSINIFELKNLHVD